MSTTELKKALTLRHGIALAIGSIAGSGILFLPSLTYAISGADVLLVWIFGTLLCFPMLFMFADMVKEVPDGSGIEGFVAKGLGRHAAAGIPVLFVSLVIIGMPSGILVAGEYLKNATGGGAIFQLAGALAIILIGAVTNLAGIKASGLIQSIITWTLLGIALLLFSLTFPHAKDSYHVITPQFLAVKPVFAGIVVAFWAYAGFENMTFIAGEFKNPQRDFFLSMFVAFIVYGALAVGLTANIAGIIPRQDVNDVAGLFQLAEKISPQFLSTWVITIFAMTLLQINTNSWLWGISRLIYSSSKVGRMPAFFSVLDERQVPRRAVIFLVILFLIVTSLGIVFPSLLVQALILASSGFMLLYVFFLFSYLRCATTFGKRALSGALLVFMIIMLVNTGWKVMYPIAVMTISILASIYRGKKAAGGAKPLDEAPQ